MLMVSAPLFTLSRPFLSSLPRCKSKTERAQHLPDERVARHHVHGAAAAAKVSVAYVVDVVVIPRRPRSLHLSFLLVRTRSRSYLVLPVVSAGTHQHPVTAHKLTYDADTKTIAVLTSIMMQVRRVGVLSLRAFVLRVFFSSCVFFFVFIHSLRRSRCAGGAERRYVRRAVL